MACDTLIDSYSSTNKDSNYTIDSVEEAHGQAFTMGGTARDLCKAHFNLRFDFDPGETATIRAALYACTGTPGTNGRPTGAALAVSNSRELTSADNDSEYRDREFVFPTPYTLEAGTNYCIVLECTAHGGSGADVKIGKDHSSPTHTGNMCTHFSDAAGWSSSADDLCFGIYYDPCGGGAPAPTSVFEGAFRGPIGGPIQ